MKLFNKIFKRRNYKEVSEKQINNISEKKNYLEIVDDGTDNVFEKDGIKIKIEKDGSVKVSLGKRLTVQGKDLPLNISFKSVEEFNNYLTNINNQSIKDDPESCYREPNEDEIKVKCSDWGVNNGVFIGGELGLKIAKLKCKAEFNGYNNFILRKEDYIKATKVKNNNNPNNRIICLLLLLLFIVTTFISCNNKTNNYIYIYTVDDFIVEKFEMQDDISAWNEAFTKYTINIISRAKANYKMRRYSMADNFIQIYSDCQINNFSDFILIRIDDKQFYNDIDDILQETMSIQEFYQKYKDKCIIVNPTNDNIDWAENKQKTELQKFYNSINTQ